MNETLIHNGREYRVTIEYDDCAEAPWEQCDGHGPVRCARTEHGDKRAGERPLNQPTRGQYQYYYDWQEAMRMARRDGWGISDGVRSVMVKRLGREPTPGEIAAEAVALDFNRLHGWCNNDWNHVVITVSRGTLSETLGGVESDYWEDSARELAAQIESQENEIRAHWCNELREARAATREAMRAYLVCHKIIVGDDAENSIRYALRHARAAARRAVLQLRALNEGDSYANSAS